MDPSTGEGIQVPPRRKRRAFRTSESGEAKETEIVGSGVDATPSDNMRDTGENSQVGSIEQTGGSFIEKKPARPRRRRPFNSQSGTSEDLILSHSQDSTKSESTHQSQLQPQTESESQSQSDLQSRSQCHHQPQQQTQSQPHEQQQQQQPRTFRSIFSLRPNRKESKAVFSIQEDARAAETDDASTTMTKKQSTFTEDDAIRHANLGVLQRIQAQHKQDLSDTVKMGTIVYDPNPISIPEIVPAALRACITYLSLPRALKEEGLFRVSGNKVEIDHLERQFDEERYHTIGYSITLDHIMEPSTVCGLLKSTLRKHDLVPDRKSARRLFKAVDESNSEDQRLRRIRRVLQTLSSVRLSSMKALLLLFQKVVGWEGNRMTVRNLSTSIGPTLFPSLSTQHCTVIFDFLLRNLDASFDDIFSEGHQNGHLLSDHHLTPESQGANVSLQQNTDYDLAASTTNMLRF